MVIGWVCRSLSLFFGGGGRGTRDGCGKSKRVGLAFPFPDWTVLQDTAMELLFFGLRLSGVGCSRIRVSRKGTSVTRSNVTRINGGFPDCFAGHCLPQHPQKRWILVDAGIRASTLNHVPGLLRRIRQSRWPPLVWVGVPARESKRVNHVPGVLCRIRRWSLSANPDFWCGNRRRRGSKRVDHVPDVGCRTQQWS